MSIFNRLSNFLTGGKGTDNWTQPIKVGGNQDLSSIMALFNHTDKKLEEWITNDNNEFKLYNTTPELKIVIDKCASMFSNGSWQVVDVKSGNIIENHQLLDLMKSPNPYQDKNLFLRHVFVQFALYGNNFSHMNYALPTSIYPSFINNLNTPQIKLIRNNSYLKQDDISSIIDSFKLMSLQDKSKVIETFKVNEIIHFKDTNPSDPIIGMSRLKSLHMPLSNIRAARGYINATYVKKGAIGILSPEIMKEGGGMLPTNQKHLQDLETQYSEHTHGSGDSQSKVIISKMPIKYTALSSALRDHLVHEEIDMSFKRIIDAFDSSSSLFSFMQQSTFSNQENGEKQAYQNGVIPISKMFCSALNLALKTVEKDGVYLQLDYMHLPCFQEDEIEKAKKDAVKIASMEKLFNLGYSKEEAADIVGLV